MMPVNPKKIRSILFVLCATMLLALAPSASAAATPAPGWAIMGNNAPTVMMPGGEGAVQVYVENVGGAPATGGTVTDTLPAGLTPTGEPQVVWSEGSHCTLAGQVATCVLSPEPTGAFQTSRRGPIINIGVKVDPTASGSVIDHASVAGGGAVQAASTSFAIAIGDSAPGAGFAHLDTWLSNPDGTTDTQAGSHPYMLLTAFALNNIVAQGAHLEKALFPLEDEAPAGGEAHAFNFNLPPGIVGNTEAIPQCPRLYLVGGVGGSSCPGDTQIGKLLSTVAGDWELIASNPIYNMVPPPGVPAQFAFDEGGNMVFLDAGVRTGGDNGITTHVPDVPQRDITFVVTEIWGVPGEHGTGASDAPLLTLPTSCQGPPEFSMEELGTWNNPNLAIPPIKMTMHDNEENPVGFTDCEKLRPFAPEISIAPDTTYADTPAGLSVDVHIQQGLNPEGLQTPGLQNTTVVLPEGVVINPGQATGLVACQPSQEAFGTEPNGEVDEGPVSCPAASKVGTVEIESPLLRDTLRGNAYILRQNPPNLQLLITASADGVNLKLLGNVHLDESTGQLTTTFEKTPDVPFTNFRLNFSGGAQAALATPTKCGTYESTANFTPWSSPFIEDALDTSRFQIQDGPNGQPCQWPMGFEPTMTAGATTDQAGGYTDFTMLLQRGDGQQRIEKLQFKTPEGLLGMISNVAVCGEPQAAQGTCSASSQIGHTVTTAGPGPYPFEVPQAGGPPAPIYLTGPYEGAPFGLSIVVPVVAGPFNLGTVVVRAKIEVDPHTSELTVTTNPLPLILDGIPTDLRVIDAVIDRPDFMFNPTSCAPMSFSGTAYSDEGATAPLSSHFQVGSCQALKFQPNFKVSTNGKTSRANGASLTAKIVYPVGNLGFNQASSQSNIKAVKVDLPKQLPSRLTTLQKACPVKVFEANPAACPVASIVGHARAITPELPVPVEGPAYFVSHAGEEFPNLIVVLQGDNVTVDLVGDTFINTKTNITSSTFKEIPDVPIQSFELNLPQGKYSALAANTNLCKVKGGLKMLTAFTGQNGAEIHQSTPISVTGCAKSKVKKKAKVKGKAKHGSGKTKRK
jgi:uncharacterized repeat protein (TIGR01451 family)